VIQSQTHEKDAVLGQEGALSKQKCTDPYTLTLTGTPVMDITHVNKTNLFLAALREAKRDPDNEHDSDDSDASADKHHKVDMKSITSHKGVHYYGHLLRQGHAIVLRAPKKLRRVIPSTLFFSFNFFIYLYYSLIA
jgi:hypothetical protein